MESSASLIESPERSPSVTHHRRPRAAAWQRRYARWVTVADLFVITTVTFGTQILWRGPSPAPVASSSFTDTTVSAALTLAWMAALSLGGTRQTRVIGYGAAEYRLVLAASTQVFGLVAIAAYLTGAHLSRGYFLLGLPLGCLALIVGRLLSRRWLARERSHGAMSARVVLIGGAEENARVAGELTRQPSAGLHVVGVHTLDRAASGSAWSAEQARRLRERLDDLDADSVLVSGGAVLDAQDIRRIGWSLDTGREHLIVAVNLTDVAGPRRHMRPVAGLPLVHIETRCTR